MYKLSSNFSVLSNRIPTTVKYQAAPFKVQGVKYQAGPVISQYRSISTYTPTEDPDLLPFTELVEDHLNPKDFYQMLSKEGVNFYVGVPDSLLKEFTSCVTVENPSRHLIACNEGSAVALAAGHYLSTGKIPVVYLQNSGLGNTANPLLSLTHPEVYGIPMLLLLGWRGEPGKKDEPQHRIQGRLSTNLCQSMDLLYSILPSYPEGADAVVRMAFKHMRHSKSPYAFLVKRNTFSRLESDLAISEQNQYPLDREGALRIILTHINNSDIVVASTGFLSREIFELRETAGQSHKTDFLTVGSMGHSPSVALGVALEKQGRQVFNIEGDGSFIMHMGITATIGAKQPKNFKQIVINNGVHDSVGGQSSGAFSIDMKAVAKACGYSHVFYAENPQQIEENMAKLRKSQGPALLEIRVHSGARLDLGRPTQSLESLKEEFMNFLK